MSLGRFYKLSRVGLAIIFAFVFYSCSKHVAQVAAPPQEARKDTVEVVQVIPPKSLRMDSVAIGKMLRDPKGKCIQFYLQHAFQTQWLLDTQPSPLFDTLERLLGNADKFGLRSSDYDLEGIQQRIKLLYENKQPNTKNLIDLDIYITGMLFKFTTHLSIGKVDEIARGKGIWQQGERIDRSLDVDLINRIQTPEQLVSVVRFIQPEQEQYFKLQQALAYYRALQNNTPVAIDIIKGLKLKQDDHHVVIPSVRKKLSLSDMHPYPMDYDSVTAGFDSLKYDATLVSAVKWFQARHGLEPDGIIGDKTLRFLNQSFREKADIIALNMERLRWSREKYGDNYILVNIPDYTLRVYENRVPAIAMRVIVGAIDKPTPVFSDVLENIVFSPTWNVPTSIIREEIIPRLRNNPSYYANKNYIFYKNEAVIDPAMETWDESSNPYQYRVVQQPGSDNSLGLVKFVLTNDMSVYLHDTPNHRLFSKDYRAMSHGCVRLDEPARFAAYLLRDQKGWDAQRIEKAMQGIQPAGIRLKKKYEVHVEYITAWVDENNMINFREDIYGHDKRQLQQLFPKDQPGGIAGL